ncbi:Fic family protein [Candidatus Pacearchaeota archaeon]|nr:Fic family protein [Candidatus Pacearchaeota archaeon]
MHIKEKTVNKKKYKYLVKSIRLPNGQIKKIEKIYKGEPKKEIEKILEEKERKEYARYMLKNFSTNHIFTEEEFEKIEDIKINYRKVIKKLTKSTLRDLLDRFTANFTYESNALEGNSLTLKNVAMIMFENTTIRGKDLREIYETRNSRKLIEQIMQNKFSVSNEDIIKMHKLLVKDTGIQTGYKKFPNEIIGRNIKTALPEEVQKRMDGLIEWYEQNKEKIHPIELAGLLHGKFEQIHPFEDGNGRVGRFLINIILVSNKYPPLIIRKSQRISYLKSLENFDNKHTDSLRRFVLERFKETYKKFFEVYVKYI